MNITAMVDMIEQDEGFKSVLYRDTRGFQTIGLGFCLDKIVMPREVAYYWCRIILNKKLSLIISNPEKRQIFEKLNDSRQYAILNMSYQLGVGGLFQFKNMWRALMYENYDKAAKEAMDSAWARQTPLRAKRIANIIRTGKMGEYQK